MQIQQLTVAKKLNTEDDKTKETKLKVQPPCSSLHYTILIVDVVLVSNFYIVQSRYGHGTVEELRAQVKRLLAENAHKDAQACH